MMEYKGYSARVEFDDGAGVFHGEVLHLRDVVTFEGRTVAELRKAFRESVDDYLAFCASRHEPPEKPFSGRFVVRIDPSLHKAIAIQAARCHQSLNAWVQATLEAAAAGTHAGARIAAAGVRETVVPLPLAKSRSTRRMPTQGGAP